jgi:hypothetical protein
VDYKLRTLRQHFVASRLLLNDLRTLRRYLFEERAAESLPVGQPGLPQPFRAEVQLQIR